MPLLEQVLERYPKDVKLVFKNFPLRNHSFARPAAAAALAAGNQGKFWEFHDRLFQDYNNLSDATIANIAEELGLDGARLKRDAAATAVQEQINRDLSDGQRVGVRGTPTILVNGKLLANRSLPGFQQMIDAELAGRGQ